ncbi:hypothetical protein LINPERPRIM_LOCUS22213 [Linum perenne]
MIRRGGGSEAPLMILRHGGGSEAPLMILRHGGFEASSTARRHDDGLSGAPSTGLHGGGSITPSTARRGDDGDGEVMTAMRRRRIKHKRKLHHISNKPRARSFGSVIVAPGSNYWVIGRHLVDSEGKNMSAICQAPTWRLWVL